MFGVKNPNNTAGNDVKSWTLYQLYIHSFSDGNIGHELDHY